MTGQPTRGTRTAPSPYLAGHSRYVHSLQDLLIQRGGKAPAVLPVSPASETVEAIGTVEFLRMIDMVWPITVPRPVLPFEPVTPGVCGLTFVPFVISVR